MSPRRESDTQSGGVASQADHTQTMTLGDQKMQVRASCVAIGNGALLIFGASGTGKSTLALDLVGLGATLVSDDQSLLRSDGNSLIASPPDTIAGRIEARHIGILTLPYLPEARVTLAIDLDQTETDRLPPRREITLLGHAITLLHRPPGQLSASSLLQCLLERRDTP